MQQFRESAQTTVFEGKDRAAQAIGQARQKDIQLT